jgi:hydroxyquinol 1,2-dioxygenase
VRNSLVIEFPKHQPGKAPDGRTMNKPYYTAHYDFKLVPSAA